jgi:hypothetical protein
MKFYNFIKDLMLLLTTIYLVILWDYLIEFINLILEFN